MKLNGYICVRWSRLAGNNSFFRGVCIFGFFLKILPEIWDKKFKMHTHSHRRQ